MAEELYQFLAQRRSASILIEPAPAGKDLEDILQVACTVPDHGALKPYRFIVVSGEAREAFGKALIDTTIEHKGADLDDSLQKKVASKAFVAPMQILVFYSPVESRKIPEWEQKATAACTGYALVLAANAKGYGAVWKSFAFDPGAAFQAYAKMKDGEEFLGWVNIGTEKDHTRHGRSPVNLAEFAEIRR